MSSDYLVVGPTHELRSTAEPARALAGSVPLCSFRLTRNGLDVGEVAAYLSAWGVEMVVASERPLPEGVQAEAMRLLARVCSRQTQAAIPLFVAAPAGKGELARGLGADGFVPATATHWQRPAGPFVVGESAKLQSSHEVYRDAYCVPWNFAPREWDIVARLVADARQSASPSDRPLRILDLGCGYGKNAVALEELGFAVFGIDCSWAAIARCQELVKLPHRFVVASAMAIPYADGHFDRILDVGCLHCIEPDEREAAVRELARVLAPTGVLYSRSYTPRPAGWLQQQPFRTTAFGLSPEAALALLAPHFTAMIWQPHPEYNYVMGRPKAE